MPNVAQSVIGRRVDETQPSFFGYRCAPALTLWLMRFDKAWLE